MRDVAIYLAHIVLKGVRREEVLLTMDIGSELVALYEISGLAVDEIAGLMEMDVSVVRLALQGGSSLYRARVENGRECDVSREEAREMMGVVKNLARGAGDAPPAVQLKAAIYAIDEHHGRNDKRVEAKNTANMNFIQINNHLAKLAAARKAAFGLDAAQAA